MKSRILLFISVLVAIPLHSQNQNKRKFFLDESQISVNRMIPNENSNETGIGFGVGVYHTFRSEKTLNLLLGLEYNRISQFKDYLYAARYQQAYDITLVANCMSFSFGPRFNIGTKTKVFFDAGIYADLLFKSQMSGEEDSCYYEELGLICATIPYKEDVELAHTAGLFIGAGLRIPVSKVELILSADYRYGLNPTSTDYRSPMYLRYFRIKLGIRIN
jgi:outer membrane protein with beta-barrel domain